MRIRPVLVAATEVLAALALCTAAVGVLHGVAATAGLSVVYLLGVLVVAVRRGTGPALAEAVLAVLALNYFFIAPVHRLAIRDSADVVALVVFLVVAVVVARLAAAARVQAREADARAAEAAARREEAELIAGVASLLLGAPGVEARLAGIGPRIAGALGVRDARVQAAAAPDTVAGMRAVALPVTRLRAWLHLPVDAAIDAGALDRVLAALGPVIDVALERDALARGAADAESARRADLAKTAVLHAISHDLRSPLTAITTAADALAGPALGPEDHADLVAVVRGESARLARLVDDLLDLSRIQAQAVNPQLDWCDLRDVAARAAGQTGVDVRIELPDDLPLVRADSAQMERVLANLLDNAARFSPPGRPVRITGGAGGGWVTVRVLDEGPGVPLGQRADIFTPFHRGRRDRGATGRGAGLGLAICKGFVEANGGRILLQAHGGPTAFAVSLPLVPQPSARR